MRVLISNVESEVKRGEILVPVRSPNGETWLAGVSSKCDANTAEVVDINVSCDDLYEFQGQFKIATMEDIEWMAREVAGYKIGEEVGMMNSKFFLIRRNENGYFWSFMVSLAALYTIAAVIFYNPLHLVITAVMWMCVMAYKHLR